MTTITYHYDTMENYITSLRSQAQEARRVARVSKTKKGQALWICEAQMLERIANELDGKHDTFIAEIHGEKGRQ